MTTATVAAPTRPQTAQLLVLLYQYVVDQTRTHPVLLPAVPALRQAAQLYGRNDLQGAYRRGVDVYQLLVRARQTNPDLPMP
jgi:hypothetical protein